MSRRVGYIALLLLVTVLYVAAGKFGLLLAFSNARVSAVWPPTGLALAALLLGGYRLWPAVYAGALIVNITTPPHRITLSVWMTGGLIACGNTLEAVTGAWLAKRFANGAKAFDRAGDLLRFLVLAALPSTILCATVGAAALSLHGLPPGNSFGANWVTWWAGDFVSDLLVAPLLIVWLTVPLGRVSGRVAAEAVVLAGLLVLVSEIIFGSGGNWGVVGERSFALGSLVGPLLLWAAFRFQQRGAAAAVCIVSAVAIAGTWGGSSPFFTPGRDDSLLFLQIFIGVEALIVLFLAAVVSEQQRAHCERLRVLESERDARAQADRANRAKDDFLAILSHELRTPLTPVLLLASSLERRGDLPAEVRTDLHHIRRSVQLEARLIEDLLDVTRIARGKLHLHPENTDLHQKIRFAADMFPQRAGDIVLKLEAPAHHIHGDAARLQQVFWNLLSNAVKFTPAGSPIRVHSENPGPGLIRVVVADTGVGIAADVLPRIFETFEQGSAEQARKFGGLGLGLSITRALVEAHGGAIFAASPGPGRGAVFTVELAVVAAAERAPGQSAPLSGPASRLRVLLVEDHPPTRGVMARLLRELGHEVTAAESAREALRAAEAGSFDLLISDIGLPDLTGHELLEKLRTSVEAGGSRLRAIAVSGYGMDRDLAQSVQAGFAAHLTKPIDLDKLESAILQATAVTVG